MDPTPEQVAAISLFMRGRTIAIEAGAGTGKTSTLVLAGKTSQKRGQYIAFNKAIVEEAKLKMPSTVKCNTAHSLAYGAVGYKYQHRMRNAVRIKSTEAAKLLGLSDYRINYGTTEKRLAPGWLAGLVNRTIANFCNSADPEPTTRHIPYTDGIDLPTAEGKRTWDANRALAAFLMPAVHRAWKDINDPDGKLRFTPDHYLKMWQLDNPHIRADFILFDEAQDASPVMLDIVKRQTAQIVWVGDTQQQIYEWRGAVNALDEVDAEHRTFLTNSFRFGPEIAEIANVILTELQADLRLIGKGGPSDVGPILMPAAILCRTNAGAFTVLLAQIREGRRPHLVGGGTEIAAFARAAKELMEGKRTIHPELACFESWGEVQDYVRNDPDGGELKLMVELIDDHGIELILETMGNMIPERDADIVISTAHKSKGREWDTVQLHGDFPKGVYMTPTGPKGVPLGASDWRLIYVAATRARHGLDIDRCDALQELLESLLPEQETLAREAD